MALKLVSRIFQSTLKPFLKYNSGLKHPINELEVTRKGPKKFKRRTSGLSQPLFHTGNKK